MPVSQMFLQQEIDEDAIILDFSVDPVKTKTGTGTRKNVRMAVKLVGGGVATVWKKNRDGSRNEVYDSIHAMAREANKAGEDSTEWTGDFVEGQDRKGRPEIWLGTSGSNAIEDAADLFA